MRDELQHAYGEPKKDKVSKTRTKNEQKFPIRLCMEECQWSKVRASKSCLLDDLSIVSGFGNLIFE